MTKLEFYTFICLTFLLSHRFPGFIFPCLGVHPVQEVSPEQQRGASVQVGPFLTVFTAVVSTLTHKNVIFISLVILMLFFQSVMCLHTVDVYCMWTGDFGWCLTLNIKECSSLKSLIFQCFWSNLRSMEAKGRFTSLALSVCVARNKGPAGQEIS